MLGRTAEIGQERSLQMQREEVIASFKQGLHADSFRNHQGA
jgi:hypothetical protein